MTISCWEFKGCGLQPGGHNTQERGVCPAAQEKTLNIIHGELNSGRACWAVAESFCHENHRISVDISHSCMSCDFYQLVRNEEYSHLIMSKVILKMTRHNKMHKAIAENL